MSVNGPFQTRVEALATHRSPRLNKQSPIILVVVGLTWQLLLALSKRRLHRKPQSPLEGSDHHVMGTIAMST